jgi:endonuclease III
MARGMGPRQPRWAKQGFGVGSAKKASKVSGRATASPTVDQKKAKNRTSASKKNVSRSKPVAGGDAGAPSPERVTEIIQRLDATYAGVTCALAHKNAWQLLVATILSAQCTDERVNKTTPALFEKYPTAQELARKKPEDIEPDIRSTGFFRNKAKSIVGAAKKVVSDFGGEVPQEMDQLLTIPGVARKTANVVLGTWFKKNVGVVVDTHVTRISRRLELTRNEDAGKIEQDLMQIIPQERWTDFSHEVIWHGRKLCVARGPKCAECPLENICHAADKTWSTVEIHKGAR